MSGVDVAANKIGRAAAVQQGLLFYLKNTENKLPSHNIVSEYNIPFVIK